MQPLECSWGAYGGVQPTPLGLCSMTVGPCHVRTSPEITRQRPNSDQLQKYSEHALIYKIDFKSQVTEVATAGSNLHRKYFFLSPKLTSSQKIVVFQLKFFFINFFVHFRSIQNPSDTPSSARCSPSTSLSSSSLSSLPSSSLSLSSFSQIEKLKIFVPLKKMQQLAYNDDKVAIAPNFVGPSAPINFLLFLNH